jgi:hypothetical protein
LRALHGDVKLVRQRRKSGERLYVLQMQRQRVLVQPRLQCVKLYINREIRVRKVQRERK